MTDAPNYNDGKWHGWNGGECPVDVESIVEGMYLRDDMPAPESPCTDRAGHFDWEYEAANTLIAFRVIKEHREPREFWLGCAGGYRHTFETPDAADTYKRQNIGAEIIHVREVIA